MHTVHAKCGRTMQNAAEDAVVKNQIYLQNFGNVDIDTNGQGRKLWRVRAITRRQLTDDEIDETRKESLQIILQNKRKFAYLDLENIQLSKADTISKLSNKCSSFSISSDGWNLFGLKTKKLPTFVTLTNDFQEVKNIKTDIGMCDRTTTSRGCILQKFQSRLVQLYLQAIDKRRKWCQKQSAFPHIASSSNGLAVVCIMQPGLIYIWEYHRTGHNWAKLDDCKLGTVPGLWKRVGVSKAEIDCWFKKQKSPRIENRVFFDENDQITGALAYTSLGFSHISIMYSPIVKEGGNFFLRFSKVTVNVNHLRSRSKGHISYIARLSSTGKHIAIGVNLPFATFIMAFLLADENHKEFDCPDKPLQLCRHCETGLSVYDVCNHKYCWVVDIQWISNDAMFAVITNCGSLAIFDSHGEAVVISILHNSYVEPTIYHQIFQRTYDPVPTTDAFQTIRPPASEYWGGLTFSLLWSAKQNVLICSSGKSVAFFSVVDNEVLPLQTLSVESMLPLNVATVGGELESDIQVNSTETVNKQLKVGDVITPSFLMESLCNYYSQSYLKNFKPSNLVEIVQRFISELPVPQITIRPVKVELHKSRSFPALPLHFEFLRKAVNSRRDESITKDISHQSTLAENGFTKLTKHESDAKISQSLPDLHNGYDSPFGYENSEYDWENANFPEEEECGLITSGEMDFEETPPFTVLSHNSSYLESTEATEKPSSFLEIPSVPEIHNVVFPKIECKKYTDSETQVDLMSLYCSAGTQTINDSSAEVKEVDKDIETTVGKGCRPKCVLPKPLLSKVEQSSEMVPSLQEDKCRRKNKPLSMVALKPFSKLSDVLGTFGQKEASANKFLPKLQQVAEKFETIGKKEKEMTDDVTQLLSKLEANSVLLKHKCNGNAASEDVSEVLGKQNKTGTKNKIYCDKRTASVKNIGKCSQTPSNENTNYVSISNRPPQSLLSNSNSSPRKQSSILLGKLKIPSYDHILPKVSTFNTAYIASTVSSPRTVRSTPSNQKAINTFNNSNVRNQGTIHLTDSKINSFANNAKKTFTKDTRISANDIIKKISNLKVKAKASGSRVLFTDDSERLINELENYANLEENRNLKNNLKRKSSSSNYIEPPRLLRATSKLIGAPASNPEGFELISKSGHSISSPSSSVKTACSKESEEFESVKQMKESSNSNKVSKLVIEEQDDTQNDSSITKPEFNLLLPPPPSNFYTESLRLLNEISEESDEQQGRKLEIEEEECELIPLRSILSQNDKKCCRRVSFCEPIALYKTISPLDINEMNVASRYPHVSELLLKNTDLKKDFKTVTNKNS